MLSLLRRVTEGDRFVRRREPWQLLARVHARREPRGQDASRRSGPAASGARRRGSRRRSVPRRVLAGREATSTRCSPRPTSSSLHVPLTPETHHLIDARRLRLMRPTAVLVNTARGPVVDEAALVGGAPRGRHRRRGPGRLRARARGDGGAARAGERRARAAPRQRHPRHADRDGDALRGRRCARSCWRAARRPTRSRSLPGHVGLRLPGDVGDARASARAAGRWPPTPATSSATAGAACPTARRPRRSTRRSARSSRTRARR